MAKKFIEELEINQGVDTYFSVKYKHPPRKYKNGYMFTIGLADKTGEIEATYWGGLNEEQIQNAYNSFKEGDVVSVLGKVSEFRNKLKIDVNEGDGHIKKINEYEIEDLVGKTTKDIEGTFNYLLETIDSISNPHLKALLDSFFKDKEFAETFKKASAAMYIHHAYIGGLLEHTTNVLKLSKCLCTLYPELDENLLLTGAILHDIGKTKEFEISTNIKISEEGMLRGHIVLGEEMVLEKISKIQDFSNTLKMKLAHMMLSHHGNGEFGSPKVPQFPEAVALYYADEYDSKVNQYIELKEKAKKDTEDFRTYSKRLGEVYLR